MKPELRQLFDVNDPDIEYIVDAIRSMKAVGCDVEDPDVLRLAIKAGRTRAAEANDDTGLFRQAREERRRRDDEHFERHLRRQAVKSCVYYARLGNRVKIGYTLNLRQRMSQVMPEELLATEPGGPAKETERHGQFAHLRTHGEWFRYEGELVDHVAVLRSEPAAG